MITSETRAAVYARAGGFCEVCGTYRTFDGPWGIRGQCAHRVARTKWAVKKYGEEVIDHPDNLAWTCPGKCNDAVLITFKTAQREALMAAIREKLLEDSR